MAEAFPGEFHELTPWAKKQLHELGGRCAANYLLAHAEKLLAYTIKHWRDFTENAKDRDGAWGNIPSRPNMTFLLKYFSAAVNLYLYDNKLEFIGSHIQPKGPLPSHPANSSSSVPKSVQSTAPCRPEVAEDPVSDMTYAEMWADDDEDDREFTKSVVRPEEKPTSLVPGLPEIQLSQKCVDPVCKSNLLQLTAWKAPTYYPDDDEEPAPSKPNSPEIDPVERGEAKQVAARERAPETREIDAAEWEKISASIAAWCLDEPSDVETVAESRHTSSVSPLRLKPSFMERWPPRPFEQRSN
jgi:hypothetical protein